jgi:hypothetical protein
MTDLEQRAREALVEQIREFLEDGILEPGGCLVPGHFRFQQNGNSCLMCQREESIRREAWEQGRDAMAIAACEGCRTQEIHFCPIENIRSSLTYDSAHKEKP